MKIKPFCFRTEQKAYKLDYVLLHPYIKMYIKLQHNLPKESSALFSGCTYGNPEREFTDGCVFRRIRKDGLGWGKALALEYPASSLFQAKGKRSHPFSPSPSFTHTHREKKASSSNINLSLRVS